MSMVCAWAAIDWLDFSATLVTVDLVASEILQPLLPSGEELDGGTSPFDPASLGQSRAVVLWSSAVLFFYLVRMAVGVAMGRCSPRRHPAASSATALLVLASSALPLLTRMSIFSPPTRLVLLCLARLGQNVAGGCECIASHLWIESLSDAGQRAAVQETAQGGLLAGIALGALLPTVLRALVSPALAWRVPSLLSGLAALGVVILGRRCGRGRGRRASGKPRSLSTVRSPLSKKATPGSPSASGYESDESEREEEAAEALRPPAGALSLLTCCVSGLCRFILQQSQLSLAAAVVLCGWMHAYLHVSLGGVVSILLVLSLFLVSSLGDAPLVLLWKQLEGRGEASLAELGQGVAVLAGLVRECGRHIEALEGRGARAGQTSSTTMALGNRHGRNGGPGAGAAAASRSNKRRGEREKRRHVRSRLRAGDSANTGRPTDHSASAAAAPTEANSADDNPASRYPLQTPTSAPRSTMHTVSSVAAAFLLLPSLLAFGDALPADSRPIPTPGFPADADTHTYPLGSANGGGNSTVNLSSNSSSTSLAESTTGSAFSTSSTSSTSDSAKEDGGGSGGSSMATERGGPRSDECVVEVREEAGGVGHIFVPPPPPRRLAYY